MIREILLKIRVVWVLGEGNVHHKYLKFGPASNVFLLAAAQILVTEIQPFTSSRLCRRLRGCTFIMP